MRKIAVFTEGQTELIFVREFLLRLIDNSKLSFICMELLARKYFYVPYEYSSPNPEIHFLIVNVHGDEGVLSSISDREKSLIEKSGYEKIIGLRDMYSEAYEKLSPGIINDSVTKRLIQGYKLTIQNMVYSDKVELYLAIMEIEAWFLAMYNVFQKIDTVLTIDFIKQNLRIDLRNTDPQKEFFKPSRQVQDIFGLCGMQYNKKESDINNRCNAFDAFYQMIISYSQ